MIADTYRLLYDIMDALLSNRWTLLNDIASSDKAPAEGVSASCSREFTYRISSQYFSHFFSAATITTECGHDPYGIGYLVVINMA